MVFLTAERSDSGNVGRRDRRKQRLGLDHDVRRERSCCGVRNPGGRTARLRGCLEKGRIASQVKQSPLPPSVHVNAASSLC